MKTFLGLAALMVCDAAMAAPIVPAIAAVTSILGSAGTAAAVGGLGALAASKLMSKKAPTLGKPKVMPTADDEQVMAAKRRQIAEMQARGGRASTILSDTGDAKLGG